LRTRWIGPIAQQQIEEIVLIHWTERMNEARRHDESCLLCEHRCAVNPAGGEKGFCKASTTARIFRHRIEYGEEPELVPCHLFYLSGCDLRCSFCIAEANAFDPSRGRELTPAFLRDAVAWGRAQGVRTLQWVGGEPTIHIPRVLDALSQVEECPPVVWKSDFYGTPEAFSLMNGVADIYVADFKFGNDACALHVAGVERYMAVVTRNLQIAAGQGRLIVRHLLLPGHFDCCFKPIVTWLERELPSAGFSLRDGYLPKWRAKSDRQLSRRLEPQEADEARRFAIRRGLSVIV
jgi:putative pyruvate formate lyase activating enzyme